MGDNSTDTAVAISEILAWLKVQNRDVLRSILAQTLSTPSDRKVYELSDGSRIAKQVAEASGVSEATVSRKWKAWRNAGLLIDTADRWKPRHLQSIESLGGLPD